MKEEPFKPTKRPKMKPPRRKPEAQKKWNDDNKTEVMRQYMRDYRSTGKVTETDSPKSK